MSHVYHVTVMYILSQYNYVCSYTPHVLLHHCCSVLDPCRHLSTTSVDDLSASDVRSSPEMSGPILRHKRTHSVQAMVGSNMYCSEENLASPRPQSVGEKKRPLSAIERASSCIDLAVDYEERKRHVSWEGNRRGWEDGNKREGRGVRGCSYIIIPPSSSSTVSGSGHAREPPRHPRAHQPHLPHTSLRDGGQWRSL